jgi:hypothetical protein
LQLDVRDLYGQVVELDRQSQRRGPGGQGQSKGVLITNTTDKFGNLSRPLRNDRPELGKVSPDRIQGRGPLPHQQVA